MLLINADIYACNQDMTFSANTKEYEGDFVLNVPPGTYEIIISHPGYETKRYANQTVRTGEPVEIICHLKPLKSGIQGMITNVDELETGNLYVDAFLCSDTTSCQSVYGISSDWISETQSMSYQVSVTEGDYHVFAFVDLWDETNQQNGLPDCNEPIGHCMVNVKDSQSLCDVSICKKGDVNGDGVIKLLDVKLAFELFLNGGSNDLRMECAADVYNDVKNNASSKISLMDVKYTFKKLLGDSCGKPYYNKE